LSQNITLALIAHDRYKEILAYFVLDHRSEFSHFHLVATRGTGKMVQKWTGLKVHLLEHGPKGGDRQLGGLAADNEVQAVIFFRDPILAGPREPDFAQLLKVCDIHEIPVATNRATAEALIYFLLNSPDRGAVTARPWGFVHRLNEGHDEDTFKTGNLGLRIGA
jgi:methylglyoxal synthase